MIKPYQFEISNSKLNHDVTFFIDLDKKFNLNLLQIIWKYRGCL